MRSGGLGTLGLSAGIVVLALLAAASALRRGEPAGPCAVVQQAALRGVPEASGVAASRRHPGVVWTHNDSGHEAELFAFDAAGGLRARVRLPFRLRDWEDVSAAPCAAGDCLYVADIGDNDRARPNVQVYRLAEPALDAGGIPRPAAFTVRYPDGAHDAEAAFVAGGELFIVTKDGTGVLYRSTARIDGDAGGAVAMRRAGRLGLELVTDAEASADGAWVAVRTPREVAIYRMADVLSGGRIAAAARYPIGGLREPQGEGVAPGGDGLLYLTSEGQPWSRGGRLASVRCPRPPL